MLNGESEPYQISVGTFSLLGAFVPGHPSITFGEFWIRTSAKRKTLSQRAQANTSPIFAHATPEKVVPKSTATTIFFSLEIGDPEKFILTMSVV